MIKPGVYIGTVVGHNVGETKNFEPQVAVNFSLSTDEGPQKITYFGYFTEKAAKYTIQNLITCGLKGNHPAGDLEIGKQVELVIENEAYEGKTRAKVRYINEIGAAKNFVSSDVAKAKLSQFEGMVMEARQNNPKKAASDDEIPF